MELSCSYLGYVYEDTQTFKVNMIVNAILNLILSIPTFFLNLSVFIVVLRTRHLPDITRLLFANLAFVDLIAGCMSQFTFVFILILLSLGRSPCFMSHITTPTGFIIGQISFLTLTCLAVERYTSVIYPLVYSIRATRKIAINIIIFTWVVSISIVLPCVLQRVYKPIEVFGGTFLVCLQVITVLCSSKVYAVTRRVRRKIQNEANRFNQVLPMRRDSKLMLTTGFIILSLILCYSHFQLLSILNLLNVQGVPSYFVYWTWTIAMANASLNPIITCYQLSTIRNGVLSLWKRQRNDNITVLVIKSTGTNLSSILQAW